MPDRRPLTALRRDDEMERLVESAKILQRELREGGPGQADDGPAHPAADG